MTRQELESVRFLETDLMIMRFKSKCAEIIKKILDMNMSIDEVAQLLRMSRQQLDKYTKMNRNVNLHTARRLRKMFGNEAVGIVEEE